MLYEFFSNYIVKFLSVQYFRYFFHLTLYILFIRGIDIFLDIESSTETGIKVSVRELRISYIEHRTRPPFPWLSGEAFGLHNRQIA